MSSDRMVGSAKIGHFNRNNDTTGGCANVEGAICYLLLDQRL